MLRARALFAALVAIASLASCSSDEPDASAASALSDALGTEMIDLVGNTSVRIELTYTDIAMAAEAEGIALPSPGESVVPFAVELLGSGAFISYGGFSPYLDDPAAWPSAVGVEPTQVAKTMSIVAGPFSSEFLSPYEPVSLDDIEALAEQDPVWAAQLFRVETATGDYLDWNGDDMGTDVRKMGGLRPLGRGHQVGVAGETVVWSATSELVEQALAAHAGDTERLADSDLVVELLAGYDGRPPQAFRMTLDPVANSAWIAMNIPGETGYTAALLALDSDDDGTPQLSPALLGGVVERSGSVVRVELSSPGGYETLLECLFTETCFSS